MAASARVLGFSEIGNEAFLDEDSMVYSGCVEGRIGKRTQVWRFAHVRATAIVGDDCMIGQGAFIGPEAKLGNNVKVQNHSDVSKYVVLEDDVFVGAGVRFCNAIKPTAKGDDLLLPIVVRRGAVIGSNACIMGGVRIGENAQVGANAVVCHDVPDGALVLGIPAKVRGFEWLK